jgi:hypothetical protein
MTIVCGDCCSTFISGPDFKFPAARAFARILCTAAMTSCCCVAEASPRAEVQARFFAKLSSTDGNWVSAFTAGSQDCWSTALASASPVRPEFSLTQRVAATISYGKVEAPTTCATSASGYSAIGATSASSSSAVRGAYSFCGPAGGPACPLSCVPEAGVICARAGIAGCARKVISTAKVTIALGSRGIQFAIPSEPIFYWRPARSTRNVRTNFEISLEGGFIVAGVGQK